MRTTLGLLGVLASVPAAAAQEAQLPDTPIVTVDQERLFRETLYGKRALAEIKKAEAKLEAENRRVEAALSAEERKLTDKRGSIPPEEFQKLADRFDEKVVARRQATEAKVRKIERMRREAQQQFWNEALPILTELVREKGAVAILNDRAVVLSADRIDITDAAISRIDARLGDGKDISDSGESEPDNGGSAVREQPDP